MKSSKLWDKVAESYQAENELGPDYLANFLELEITIGDNLKNKNILEVGSGTGITSAYLAGKGAKLTLLDISAKSLEFQKKYFRTKKLTAEFCNRDLFSMKFPKESFDVVWSGGVIEHFPDDKKVEMIHKMWKLVKPGGQLIIVVPNAEDRPFMIAKYFLVKRNKWAFGFEDDLTPTRLIDLSGKAGIKNVSTRAYNPIVGWWFFPYGKEITNLLGLNQVKYHRLKSAWGHALILKAKKPI